MLQTVDKDEQSLGIDKCLAEAIEKYEMIEKKNTKPFLTVDIGEDASNFWAEALERFDADMKTLETKLFATISRIVGEEWDIKVWQESFRNIGQTRNAGYIAALQRTIASNSDCLILVGGGHFQNIAFQDYKRNHPNEEEQCIHYVCLVHEVKIV